MVLSRLIVTWLEWIIEIGIWIVLIAAFIAGVRVGDGLIGGLFSGLVSVLLAGIFCAVVFGFFIVLNDIRTMLRKAIDSRPPG